MLKRPLLKREILQAQEHTLSAAAAARYLHVSYKTYKKYAQMYDVWKTNQRGVGISRVKRVGKYGLQDILDGNYPNYDKKRLRDRLIAAGYFTNECQLCGYNKVRPTGRAPLLLHLKDGSKNNFSIDNLELRCFNCTYITTGRAHIRDFSRSLTPDVLNDDIEEALPNTDFEDLQREALEEISGET